jgi:hypothetical protein
MKGKRIRAENIIWKKNESVKRNKEKGIKACVKKWVIKMCRIQDLKGFLSVGKLAGRLREWLQNNVVCKPRHRGCLLQKTVLADAVFCTI